MLVTLRVQGLRQEEKKDPRNKVESFIPVKGSDHNFLYDVLVKIFWFENKI